MPNYKFPPGPPQSFLIGNARDVDTLNVYKSLFDHKEKYGPVSYVSLGGRHVVSLNTADAIRDAFLSPGTSARPANFTKSYILLDDIVAQSPSEKWHAQKCVLQKAIDAVPFTGDTSDETEEELTKWSAMLREKNVSPFDPTEAIDLSVANSYIIFMVGRRLEYDHDIFNRFRQFNENALQLYKPMNRALLTRFPFIRHLPFWLGQHFQETVVAKETIAKYLLEDSKKDDGDYSENSGMIYELLKEKKSNENVKDAHIVGAIMDIYSGAIITTAACINVIIYALRYNPGVQLKLQREVDNVVGAGRKPRVEHMYKMPYTEAVILESQRWSGLIPLGVAHSTSEDTQLFDYFLPEGTIVLPNIWRVHRDTELWDDPWTFKPERFLDENGKMLPEEHPNRQNMLLFYGIGGRACMSPVWAQTRLFLYLASLSQTFHIYNDSLAQGAKADPRDFSFDVLMRPPPYTIQLKERT